MYYDQLLEKGPDTAPIFARGDVVVAEDDFYTSRQPHLPIEPDVGYAYVNEEGKLVIHSKSIGLHLHGLMIADGLGLDFAKDMIMVQTVAGGTFGYKFSPTMESLLGVAALATGRPCHLHYNYEEQQTYTGKRSPSGPTSNWRPTSPASCWPWSPTGPCDDGPYSEFGDSLTLPTSSSSVRATTFRPSGATAARCAPTMPGVRPSCGRRGPESEFASEVLMDELAEKLGMDPLELRYKNVYREGSTNPSGQVPDAFSLPEMIDILRPKYEAAKAKAAKESTPEVKHGVGVAIGIYGCGLDGPELGLKPGVQLDPDGGVDRGRLLGRAWAREPQRGRAGHRP